MQLIQSKGYSHNKRLPHDSQYIIEKQTKGAKNKCLSTLRSTETIPIASTNPRENIIKIQILCLTLINFGLWPEFSLNMVEKGVQCSSN